jgi:hypothetical protein
VEEEREGAPPLLAAQSEAAQVALPKSPN